MYIPIFDVIKNRCNLENVVDVMWKMCWKQNISNREIEKWGNGNNSKEKIRANKLVGSSREDLLKVLSLIL